MEAPPPVPVTWGVVNRGKIGGGWKMGLEMGEKGCTRTHPRV